jgi:hypothetical protein
MSLTKALIAIGLSASLAAIPTFFRARLVEPRSALKLASPPDRRSGVESRIEPRISALRAGMTLEESDQALWNGPTPRYMEIDTGTGGNFSWTTYPIPGGELHLSYEIDTAGVPRLHDWNVSRP